MNKIKQCIKVLAITYIISMIAACGQKGDLYMPEPSSISSFFG